MDELGIGMDELGIGIELDISVIGDLGWLAAAEGAPEEEQAAATSASAPAPTATRKAVHGLMRLVRGDLDMIGPPKAPRPADGHPRKRLR